jgi:hypothetical protein
LLWLATGSQMVVKIAAVSGSAENGPTDLKSPEIRNRISR